MWPCRGVRNTADLEREFSSLYLEHYSAIYRYFLRRGHDDHIARDLTAEVFATAWRRWSECNVTLPWLFGVARNTSMGHRRATMRYRQLVSRLAQQPVHPPGDDATDAITVRQALLRLRLHDQEILMLSAWEGLLPKELAQVLGCSTTAATVRLHRARRRLRLLLLADVHPIELPAPSLR